MAKKDKRIDAYIKNAEPFAQPILTHLRELVHKACPEVEETMKWSFPHFDYKGMMCSMASFKKHAVFGFWKAALMKDAEILIATAKNEVAMGHLGRITSIKELPSDKVMLAYIKEAAKLNDNEVKLPSKNKATEKKEIEIPKDLMMAFRKNKDAKKTYDEFSYSNKKEYVEWIMGAKTEATREKRLVEAINLMAEGKVKNWKYLKK